MKILLDGNLPQDLRKVLPGHGVETVQYRGWKGLSNGRLLAVAEHDFDVFITADNNMQYQNSIAKFRLALIVLKVRSTRSEDVLPMAQKILDAIANSQAGQVYEVSP